MKGRFTKLHLLRLIGVLALSAVSHYVFAVVPPGWCENHSSDPDCADEVVVTGIRKRPSPPITPIYISSPGNAPRAPVAPPTPVKTKEFTWYFDNRGAFI